MTEELKPSDVLDHAANLIDGWGWTQLQLLHPTTGAMCHVGAIRAATGSQTHRRRRGEWMAVWTGANVEGLTEAALEYDRRACGKWPSYWNDCDCQSKDEAVAMLRKAAAMAREAGE